MDTYMDVRKEPHLKKMFADDTVITTETRDILHIKLERLR